MPSNRRYVAPAAIWLTLLVPAAGFAQGTTFHVDTEAALQSALTTAGAGDTVVFDANISLTADLPSVSTSVVIDGAGHALSGSDQFRGLLIVRVPNRISPPQLDVAIQNLTITNTVAIGGNGGAGVQGGGGGAGLGGALFVGDFVNVTLSNVNLNTSGAAGGAGGAGIATENSSGGGGGLGGNGGAAGGIVAGGGGGAGRTAAGGTGRVPGGPGIITGAGPGGTSGTAGGSDAGGGGAGIGGAGGGAFGGGAGNGVGGDGGFAGGGGGYSDGASGSGGYGGGGGGGNGGAGGYAGGGGGTTGPGPVNAAGFGGGEGNDSGAGGGGALGGAIFVQQGGTVTVTGALSVNGSSVTGGLGSGGGNGAGYGAGMFLAGAGSLRFNLAAGVSSQIGDSIADAGGILGPAAVAGRWSVVKDGQGTVVLSGNNLYSNGTFLNGGTLSISSDVNLGTGALTLNAGTLAVTASTALTHATFLSGTPLVNVAPGAAVSWLGRISDGAGPGRLEITGGGVVTLADATNAYSGGTIVTGGSTLVVASNGALGNAASGVTLGNTVSHGTLSVANSVTSARAFTLGAGGGTIEVQGASTFTLTGGMSGAGGLTKSGAGVLALFGTNSATGGTVVGAGVLRAGIANAFSNGPTAVAAGATLDLAGFSQSVGALSGAGSIALGAGTLTTNDGGASSAFTGGISGTGELVKLGSGSLTLTGANTYSGGTTVLQGALIGNATSLQGNVVNNALVVFDQAASGTYAGAMSGTGALVKNGIGALTFSGVNNYSGGTTVLGGTLIGTTSSLRGGIANGSVVIFDQATTGTYAGLMTGSGSFIKSGTGTVVVSAHNSYTGGTSVATGVLRAGIADAFGDGSMIVDSGATLDLDGYNQSVGSLSGRGSIALGSATLTTGADGSGSLFSGNINGSGTLVKTGAGALTLTGVNGYSGGTTVSGGALIGTTTSLQGAIRNNALVVFDQSANGSYSGVMSGSGALIKEGTGELTLGGANTYTGGTLINRGAIFGTTTSLQGTIVNNARLNIDAASDSAFNGVIGGSGLTTKTGAGSLSLLGAQATSGLFNVSQGTLILNGIFGGRVNVFPGASLRATGTILGALDLFGSLFLVPAPAVASGVATNGLASGNALTTPPILTIAGNLNALPGSTISLPVGAGPNPSILVGGVATLNGTHLDVLAPDLGTARSSSFIALTGLQGLVLSNVEAATQNRNLLPYLKQNANSLFVTLLNLGIPLAGAVTNPNSISAAQSVDRVKGAAAGDLGFVVRELTALTDAELNEAMQQVAAEVHSSSLQLAVYDSQAFTDLVRRQIVERDHEREGVPGWGGERVRWWGQFGGERGRFDNRGGARGGLLNMGSGASGMDFRASERWLIGAGGGFGAGHMGIDGLSAATDFKAPRAFGYVGYKPKGFGLRAGGSAARASTQTERRLAFAASLPAELGASLFTGGIDRLAEAEETEVLSDQWSEYADDLNVRTYTIDWTLGVRRARFGRSGFTETGAGALSLVSDGDVLNLTQTDVKLHVWRRKGRIRPYVESTYRRELTKGALLTTLRFAAAPNSAFEVKGLPVAGDTFAGRAGVTLMTRVGAMTFEYQMQRAAGQLRQSADARIRFK